jgi:hypothetical protein
VTDIHATDEGTVVILRPASEAGRAWMTDRLEDAPGWAQWCGGVVCDHGPAAAIIDGAHAAGLAVEVTR